MEITRGDTAKFKFQRIGSEGNIIGTKADEIFFTVKRSSYDKEYVIQKTLKDMEFDDDHYYHFTLEPEDTDALEYGTYRYDIEAIQDGAKTTIDLDEFIITEEVTYAINEVEDL